MWIISLPRSLSEPYNSCFSRRLVIDREFISEAAQFGLEMSKHQGRIECELMDEPHLEGHRVSVRRIHALVEERDLDPQTVADRLDVDIADVYRSLAYYHDNPGEMHDVERRRKRRVEAARENGAVTGPERL